jgi:hypothetical protein
VIADLLVPLREEPSRERRSITAMRSSTGWWDGLKTDRRSQLKRPFWRRAGIWWLHLLLGSLFVTVGLGELFSGMSAGIALMQLSLGAVYLASVPFAYRQNQADRISSHSASIDE